MIMKLQKLYTFHDEYEIGTRIHELDEQGKYKELREFLLEDETGYKIKCYGKYLYNIEGVRATEGYSCTDNISKGIQQMLLRADMGNFINTCYKLIREMSRRAVIQKEFYKHKTVYISKEELDFINSYTAPNGFKTEEIRKVLFVLLVMAKCSKSNRDLCYSERLLFNVARYKFNNKKPRGEQMSEVLRLLVKQGLIKGSVFAGRTRYSEGFITRSYYRVTYSSGENIATDGGIEIKRYDSTLILDYLESRDDLKNSYCQCCGESIKQPKTGRKAKYCSKCKPKVQSEQIKASKKASKKG